MRFGIIPAFFFLAAFSSAQPAGMDGLRTSLSALCVGLTELIPIISMLLVVGGGIVYAAGQLLGAETRSRASAWASAMLIGALIGIIITVAAPVALTAMYGCEIRCGVGAIWGSGPC